MGGDSDRATTTSTVWRDRRKVSAQSVVSRISIWVASMVRIVGLISGSALVILSVFVVDAGGQTTPDPHVERGHNIANRICWACHVVGTDQEFSPILRNPGPDFRVIAKRKTVTAASLTTFLQSMHRMEGKPYTMPDPRLTDAMIDDVASYIMSLQNRP
jgi:mono/diheme cytochrome c family protein